MTVLHIPDMSCGHCKASIEAALSPLAAQIAVDLPARRVQLTGADDLPAALAALNAIGFPAEILAD
ncbi:MAG: heavy-metal-associated domain-containing protein [Cypionkella sp.]|nr:heavy-metal-associated domain-containing protein [Cypionkella sp.]